MSRFKKIGSLFLALISNLYLTWPGRSTEKNLALQWIERNSSQAKKQSESSRCSINCVTERLTFVK